MLGHSSISVTLDTYSHMLPTMGAVAQQAMERTLAPEVEPGEDAPRELRDPLATTEPATLDGPSEGSEDRPEERRQSS